MRLWLLETDANIVGLILRFTLAVVIFPHGAQKVLGWFGGQGFKPTVQFFTSAGIPPVLALLAIAAEFLGCVPPSTRGIFYRAVRLMMPTVIRDPLLQRSPRLLRQLQGPPLGLEGWYRGSHGGDRTDAVYVGGHGEVSRRLWRLGDGKRRND